MRRSVRKHYSRLDRFVRVANLGWEELLKRDDFPTLDKLDLHGKHRALLTRIGQIFDRRFREIRPAGKVPLLYFPNWLTTSPAEWPQLHSYALVRRIFDSLHFLTSTISFPREGTQMVPVSLALAINPDGSVVRVPDPFEDFLTELGGCDLRRLRACPACKRFFVAWRFDQKACRPRCANLIRVHRFRQKKDEYAANRKFRQRTGLQAVRSRRNQLIRLHRDLRSNQDLDENPLVFGRPKDDTSDPSEA
jgi:hypothetical protein